MVNIKDPLRPEHWITFSQTRVICNPVVLETVVKKSGKIEKNGSCLLFIICEIELEIHRENDKSTNSLYTLHTICDTQTDTHKTETWGISGYETETNSISVGNLGRMHRSTLTPTARIYYANVQAVTVAEKIHNYLCSSGDHVQTFKCVCECMLCVLQGL